MNNKQYTMCAKCIMDTSDPRINFDQDGICEYCNNYSMHILPEWKFGKNRVADFEPIAAQIRASGKGKKYDCILGLSGGLDSAYMAHAVVTKFKLRPLLFHVDVGWNSRIAVSNIEKIVDGLGMHLFTEVVNWKEMKGLQRSFFMSQIPDQDYPQDIAYISMLYKFARQNNIKYILNGGNFSTECCREPEEWGGYLGVDSWLVGDIVKKFKQVQLKTFPLVDILVYKILYKYIYGLSSIYPLNYVPYTRELAETELQDLYGCEKFQHKHHESRFTRFYEDYWLPRKFGFDKRRAHFSSLVMTGQMTREEAIARIASPELSEEQLSQEFSYVAKKLGFSDSEFQTIFEGDNKTYADYKNKRSIIMWGAKVMRFFGLERRLFK